MRERVLEYLKQCFLNTLVQNKSIILEKMKELIPFADIIVNEETPILSSVTLDFGEIVLIFQFNYIEKGDGLFKLASIN